MKLQLYFSSIRVFQISSIHETGVLYFVSILIILPKFIVCLLKQIPHPLLIIEHQLWHCHYKGILVNRIMNDNSLYIIPPSFCLFCKRNNNDANDYDGKNAK